MMKLGFLTLMPPSHVSSLPAAFKCMKMSSVRCMGRESGRLNMLSLLPLFWLQQAVWHRRLLASKWNDEYWKVMGWLCCVLSFLISRCSIACIFGVHSSSIEHVHKAPPSLDVACVESHLNIKLCCLQSLSSTHASVLGW